MGTANQVITICSDSVGETAEAVVQATIRQFDGHEVKIYRNSHIKNKDEICEIMEEAVKRGGFVVYTFVQPELRGAIKQESIRLNIRAIDLMGPMMEAFVDTFHDLPKKQPGLLHQLDEDYFQRIAAIEFAVKCDDGRDINAMQHADIILLGVSRTSKTPLSIFLARKGLKVANYPLVPEVKPPKLLFEMKSVQMIGLTANAEHLLKVRTVRLKSAGLPNQSRYNSLKRISEELENADKVFKQIGCPEINVSDKAIEETAGIILEYIS